MAEKNIRKVNVGRPVKRLHTDNQPIDQPQGTVRFALNIKWNDTEGNFDSATTEQSNTQCATLKPGYYPIGHVYINNNRVVIFSTDGDRSEIGIFAKDCEYQEVVNSGCLNFDIKKQIDPTYRLRRGCEDTVYWTDGVNPVRYFNFAKQDDFYTDEYKAYLLNPTGEFEGEIWNCNLFDLFPGYKVPCFSDAEVITGGALPSGSYNFAIQYLDADLNPTNWIYTSQLIGIYRDDVNSPYPNITGSSNTESDELGGGSDTNKAIRLTLSNLDDNFTYYRIAVIEASNFTGQVSRVIASPEIAVEVNTYTWDGNTDGYTQITLEEIGFDKLDIETAQHIEQIENRLILANIKGKQVNFCDFQRFASKIGTKYIVKEVEATDQTEPGSPKSPNTWWEKMSYMGDEVYAFGIVYVFDDGYESPAYHIPGRPKDCVPCDEPFVEVVKNLECIVLRGIGATSPGCSISWSVTYTLNGVQTTRNGLANTGDIIELVCTEEESDTLVIDSSFWVTNPSTGCGDLELLVNIEPKVVVVEEPCDEAQVVAGQDTTVISTWTPDIEHLVPADDAATYNALPDEQKLERWQAFNTASAIDDFSGFMAYWECSNSNYRTGFDCEGEDYWGVDFCGNSLVGTPIRHHKFPCRNLVPHVREGTLVEERSCINVNIQLAEGETFPVGGPYTLTIDYDYNTVPQPSINIIITTEADLVDFPQSIVCEDGDISTLDNIVLSGNLTAQPEFEYSANVINGGSNTVDATVTRLLGIEFQNIEYPHPDIVGHYFVRAKRDSFNRTILDKGIAGRLIEKTTENPDIDYITFSYFTAQNYGVQPIIPTSSEEHNFLLTPRFMYRGDTAINPEYLRLENQFLYSGENLGYENYDGKGGFIKETDTLVEHRVQYYDGVDGINGNTNYCVEKSIILNGLEVTNDYETGKRLYNLSHTNRIQVVSTKSPLIKTGDDINYVAAKADRDVHCNLESIKYYRTHNCMLTINSNNQVFGGDVFISPFNIANTLFREFYQSPWGALFIALAIIVAAVVTVLTAGAAAGAIAAALAAVGVTVGAGLATGIAVTAIVAGLIGVTAQTVRAVTEAYKENNLDELAEDDVLDGLVSKSTSNIAYANEYLTGIYIESEINTGMKQRQIHACGNIYTGGYIGDYFRDKILFFDDEQEKYFTKGIVCPEIYWYNEDYSRENCETVYFPLPITYDCCSPCLEEHPHRVHYSEQSFQEELSDNYRVFLPNNYRDVEGEHGVITDLWRRHNNLYVHTSEALWQLPQSYQERVTDEIVSFIGTGSFFEIPPRKTVDDDMGSAGTQDKWATVKTRFGLFFVSQIEGKVYMFTDKLNEVSKKGMERWFDNNLGSFLGCQFERLTGVPFPNLSNPSNPNGVGLHATYDSFYHRILLTKRDYELLPEFEDTFQIVTTSEEDTIGGSVVEGAIVFDDRTCRFGQALFDREGEFQIVFIPVSLDNELVFENKSWTIAFGAENQMWESWMSYIPKHYISTKQTFYSFIDAAIWQHNVLGNYLTFYGNLHDQIIEYVSVSNPVVTRLWSNLIFQTIAERYDAIRRRFVEERFITYTDVIAYNDRQCTGKLSMIVKDTTADQDSYMMQQVDEPATDEIIIDRNERDWTANDLRDYVSDYSEPLFTEEWASRRSNYFIDKNVNNNVIDFNKDWTELESFRDKYLIIRLIFSNFDNIRLTTNYVMEDEVQSFR